MSRRAVSIVGIGDDGCRGLTSRAMDAIARAQVLVGGERQLAFFPEFHGERLPIKGGLDAVLARVAQWAEDRSVCVLASGDPLFFGIGARIIETVGRAHVEVIPQPSSVQWAFARAGIAYDHARVLSLHGRPLEQVVSRIRGERRVAILTDRENTPQRIAAHLIAYGETGFSAFVLENLCGPGERCRSFDLSSLAQCDDVGPLNVLLLERSDPDFREPALIPYLPESAFEKRMPKQGLITKREVRLLSLGAMQLRRDSVVWDVGAGSGSVGIEAALLASSGHVYAVEVDPEGVEICRENARTHGADNMTVISGLAPQALGDLPAPDAVFVGGSKGSMRAIIELALQRLKPGGRLVVNAITLENSHECYACLRERDLIPEVTMLQVSRAAPLARYMRFDALNPIQIFAVTRP
ncbi:MAG: precorrin-6y C5,15-methyltransferase (decarboxylating) subunit CbiE [Myxococcales bacterium]